ncbi:MAG: FumA C-terminus/TtdB family hydratase beta subunit [Candidatus Adiutrix sp.]|jgi:fumarate hydratase subunit beta|nr:FumA C-terminus/TtdB family hydratase beta subunit [Candidatus Adiutrix sp.]
MAREYHFQLPVNEEQMRELQIGDLVYLSGIVITMRDISHRKAVDMLGADESLPVDFTNGALWHCAPIVRQKGEGQWEAVAAGSTTSSKFSKLGAELIRKLQIRCTIGKGTMFPPAVDAMEEVGAVFLNATGGAAAMYACQIKEVVDAFWLELGLPEALWVLRVEEMGPFIVGIDSHRNSLFDEVGAVCRENLQRVYADSHISPDYTYTYLPKRVMARSRDKK